MNTSDAPTAQPLLATLLPVALVGTERMPAPNLQTEGEIGELITAIGMANASDPHLAAAHVLRLAGVVGICAQAGVTGFDGPALPPPASDETKPAIEDPPQLAALRWALSDGPTRLQREALGTLARHGWRLPPALLPMCMELGRRSIALRAVIDPVLGQRGRWLAGQNPSWVYASGVAPQPDGAALWSEGSLEQRASWLRDERAHDADAARSRLESSLGELPASERAVLSAALAVGLSPSDEPLLDQLLRDRAREVRQTALSLLLRLPNSAHGHRAASRVQALVTTERGLLRKRWVIDAPSEASDSWKADDIEALRPKNESLGERAWWLYQLARQVPAAWWSQQLDMSPAAVIEWGLASDWAEALARAWRDALLAAPDIPWCEALLAHWPQKHLGADTSPVLTLLPMARRERFWQQQMNSDGNAAALAHVVSRLLSTCPPGEQLSEPFSAQLITALGAALPGVAATPQAEYSLRASLPELACVLHPAALPQLNAHALAGQPDLSLSITTALRSMAQIADARTTLSTLPVASRRSAT